MRPFTLEEEINNLYSSTALQDIYKRYLAIFLESQPQIFAEWGLIKNVFQGLSIRKSELARLLSIIFSDRTVFRKWFETLPIMVKKVLKTIIWEGAKNISRLNKKTGQEILRQNSLSPAGTIINEDYCFFLVIEKKGRRKIRQSFDLPPTVKNKLKTFLPTPGGYTLKPLKTLDKTEFVFKNNDTILKDLLLIINFIQLGNLKKTKNGTPRKASIHKLRDLCESEEFYINSDINELRTIKTELLIHLFSEASIPVFYENPLDLLKKLFENYLKSRFSTGLSLLSHIKGWSHTSSTFKENTRQNIFALLKEMPVNRWVSIRQINRFRLVRQIDINPVSGEEAEKYLYLPAKWNGWGNRKKIINDENFEKTIIIPLIKTIFSLFAAFGLVDSAYNQPENILAENSEKPCINVFDGLMYVRLTELGAYIAGREKQYDYDSSAEKKAKLVLEEDRLIIFQSTHNKLMELTMEKFAEKIGRHRYKVSFTSFLKGCTTESDIRAKIQFFKKTINSTMPAIWEKFFEKAISKANPLTAQSDLVVYKLPENDIDLINYITTDKKCGDLILKMENYHIAINKDNYQRVKTLLENQGYLL